MEKVNYSSTYFTHVDKNQEFYKRLILSLSYDYANNLSILTRSPVSIGFKFNIFGNYAGDIQTYNYIPAPSEAKRLSLKELVDFGIQNQTFNFKINLEDKSEEIIGILKDLGFELNDKLLIDKYLLVKNSKLHFISHYKTFYDTTEIELFIEDIHFLEEKILQLDSYRTEIETIQNRDTKIKVLTLIKLLNYRENFLKEKCNYWRPDWIDQTKNKYCIKFNYNSSSLVVEKFTFYERIFSFLDDILCREFVDKYSKDLLKIKDLL